MTTQRATKMHEGQVAWLNAVERTSQGLKGAARSIANSLGATVPLEEQEPSYPPAPAFADLHIYSSVKKANSVRAMFGLKNPFNRVHEGRLGATTISEGREFINFASYDYLGLNQEPAVAEAAKAAIDRYGTSVSASRLVAGERPLHGALERALADFYGTEDCIVYVSGHATNVSTVGVLMEPDDLIVYDELMHNSGIVGGKLSRATMKPFQHNNLEALEKVLKENRGKHKNCLILIEGLYSMDGDFPDLPRVIELKKKYGAWLMCDEAHSLGVLGETGRGVGEHFGVNMRDVDIWMGTLSKTLGTCGGYICGNHGLIDLLRHHSPGYVYSVGLSPPLAAGSLAALELLKAEPQRVKQLQENGQLFLEEARKAGLDVMTCAGYSVIPVVVGCPVRAVRLTESLLEDGINALPIIFPAVPMKAARLRFFITSRHTPEQIRQTVRLTAEKLTTIAKKQSMLERAALAVAAPRE
ncbi:MAG: aminotransferase class I/II-fold pyridoxal phosphate-dependent enzyme [Hyphomicrobiaceae bacterium]|nr:aminotransferase class I/II-fold pyridoxal phosphate-dependent enzyme [Hyphomicrobiaceae bacterium]